MAFQYTDQHKEDYITKGFTVLHGLIPHTLLADLRHETDKAREIARRIHGPQTQRLQPVYAYDDLKHSLFRDFLELPGFQATIEGILGKGHQQSDNMGVLLEPAEGAWCTSWHRDWADNVPHIDRDVFFETAKNLRVFNQFNGALYDDHSFWAVPGSHDRNNTDAERAAFPIIPPPQPEFPEQMSLAERETLCSAYARSMPGGVPLALCAGDVAFYRASQWHLGNYIPYTKRATLHDCFYCEEDFAWQRSVKEWREAANAAAAV